MKAFRVFKSEHQDLIHDVAFDYYAKRIASCSSDGTIRIWDQSSENGEWRCTDQIKAHTGTIHRVVWAHPEFGQVLASCGSDNEVAIFEETPDGWKRHVIGHAKDAVVCVEFAPQHLGLKLATASLDGRVRVYSCTDPTLVTWTAPQILEVAQSDAYCLAWSPSPFEGPALAVGARDRVRIYNFYEEHNRWAFSADLPGHQGAVYDVAWAPGMGRSYHLIATACADSCVRIFKYWPYGRPAGAADATTDLTTPFGFIGENLLEAMGPSSEDILLDSVSQPPPGLIPESKDADSDNKSRAFTRGIAVCVATLSAHESRVRRVQWNLTATTLASSADDGTVRLWAEDLDGVWRQVMIASGEDSGARYAEEEPEDTSSKAITGASKQPQLVLKPPTSTMATTSAFGARPAGVHAGLSQVKPSMPQAGAPSGASLAVSPTAASPSAEAPTPTAPPSTTSTMGSKFLSFARVAPSTQPAVSPTAEATVSTTTAQTLPGESAPAPAPASHGGTPSTSPTAQQTATSVAKTPFGGTYKLPSGPFNRFTHKGQPSGTGK